jgi:hypothetical protein
MTLAELNSALGLVDDPKAVSKVRTEFFGTQPTCDNMLSCAYTINCGSDTGTSCVCKGC